MAGELVARGYTGTTVGVQIWAGGRVWNRTTAAYEVYTETHWTDYLIPTVEQGSSGTFIGDFPFPPVEGVPYSLLAYQLVDGTSTGDQLIGGPSPFGQPLAADPGDPMNLTPEAVTAIVTAIQEAASGGGGGGGGGAGGIDPLEVMALLGLAPTWSGASAATRYERYPTAEDLQAYILDSGLSPPDTDLQIAIHAGIEDLENRCSRHFLAGYTIQNVPQAAYTRRYDPPSQWAEGAWATFLDLGDEGDLIRLDSVIWQPASSEATPLIDGEQYRVGPRNAVARGKPINWLEMSRFSVPQTFWSSWGAVQVTGLWGYGTQIPPDVWQAFLANAALGLFSSRFRGAGVPLGLKGWTGPEGIRKEYDASMLTSRLKQWQDIVGQTAAQNGRLSFG